MPSEIATIRTRAVPAAAPVRRPPTASEREGLERLAQRYGRSATFSDPVAARPDVVGGSAKKLPAAAPRPAPIADDAWMCAVLKQHLPQTVSAAVEVTVSPTRAEPARGRWIEHTVTRRGSTAAVTIPRAAPVPTERTVIPVPAAAGHEGHMTVTVHDADATHQRMHAYVSSATTPGKPPRASLLGPEEHARDVQRHVMAQRAAAVSPAVDPFGHSLEHLHRQAERRTRDVYRRLTRIGQHCVVTPPPSTRRATPPRAMSPAALSPRALTAELPSQLTPRQYRRAFTPPPPPRNESPIRPAGRPHSGSPLRTSLNKTPLRSLDANRPAAAYPHPKHPQPLDATPVQSRPPAAASVTPTGPIGRPQGGIAVVHATTPRRVASPGRGPSSAAGHCQRREAASPNRHNAAAVGGPLPANPQCAAPQNEAAATGAGPGRSSPPRRPRTLTREEVAAKKELLGIPADAPHPLALPKAPRAVSPPPSTTAKSPALTARPDVEETADGLGSGVEQAVVDDIDEARRRVILAEQLAEAAAEQAAAREEVARRRAEAAEREAAAAEAIAAACVSETTERAAAVEAESTRRAAMRAASEDGLLVIAAAAKAAAERAERQRQQVRQWAEQALAALVGSEQAPRAAVAAAWTEAWQALQAAECADALLVARVVLREGPARAAVAKQEHTCWTDLVAMERLYRRPIEELYPPAAAPASVAPAVVASVPAASPPHPAMDTTTDASTVLADISAITPSDDGGESPRLLAAAHDSAARPAPPPAHSADRFLHWLKESTAGDSAGTELHRLLAGGEAGRHFSGRYHDLMIREVCSDFGHYFSGATSASVPLLAEAPQAGGLPVPRGAFFGCISAFDTSATGVRDACLAAGPPPPVLREGAPSAADAVVTSTADAALRHFVAAQVQKVLEHPHRRPHL